MDTTSPRVIHMAPEGAEVEIQAELDRLMGEAMVVNEETPEAKVQRLEWENKGLREDLKAAQERLDDEHQQQMRWTWSDAYCAAMASPIASNKSPEGRANAAVEAYRKRWMGETE